MRPHTSGQCIPARYIVTIGLCLVACLLLAPSGANAQQVLLPSSPAGWSAEMRNPMDISDYLAFHKIQAAERMAAAEERQTSNQELYDATYYNLDLTIDPTTNTLTGMVRIDAEVLSGPLTTLELDLDNLMTVSSVTSGGNPTTFTHAADILTVDLDVAYETGELVTLVVGYSGNPQAGGAWGWDTHLGDPMVWTLSEPYGARTWWPCQD